MQTCTFQLLVILNKEKTMKYGFIGCGNMGGALAKALSETTKDIMISDYLPEKAESLAKELGCAYGNNQTVAEGCERIFLGVKPQVLRSVVEPIAPELAERKPLLISMAAGIKISQIEEMAGRVPVIRIMPNTPVSIGKGMILYCANDLVTAEMLDSFVSDMQYAGSFDLIDEKLIDAGSAVSGCGPAFMYMFMEALADGGVTCGLPRDKALRYAAETMAGAAELVLASGKHPGELKDAVCSPGGSTIAGVRALEENGLRAAGIDAVIKAYERTKELSGS